MLVGHHGQPTPDGVLLGVNHQAKCLLSSGAEKKRCFTSRELNLKGWLRGTYGGHPIFEIEMALKELFKEGKGIGFRGY